MKRHNTPRVLLATVPFVSALALAGCGDEARDIEDGIADAGDGLGELDEDEVDGTRITGVGVGEGGLSYEGLEGGEQDSRGPAAYLVDERGLNWIADGPGNQVLVADDFGEVVERYALDGLVRHIEDIEVTATHLYVYETGLAQPTVARVGRSDLSGGT
ncbi:MAG: hypothetical protein KC431_23065, partial [Myxococcales bacterium]|nr:hypothetical protein [Myxococcales bacterium]